MDNKWTNYKGDALVKPEEVTGYAQLIDANKKLFEAFLNNFYKGWGLEARATIKPIRIKFYRDSEDGIYLRFDYEIYERKEWLHVKGPSTWY